jgi:Cu(I)/Ag(I) efflux system protein CusF
MDSGARNIAFDLAIRFHSFHFTMEHIMPMQLSLAPILIVMSLAVPIPALAQDNHMIHAQAKATAPNVAWSEGVVKTIQRQEGQMTISHGPLVNLGMGKMTMTFRVKTPALFEGVKDGSKIRFVAESVNGELTVVALEAVK